MLWLHAHFLFIRQVWELRDAWTSLNTPPSPPTPPPPLFSGVIFVLSEAAGSRVSVTQLQSLWILRAENMGKILLEELFLKFISWTDLNTRRKPCQHHKWLVCKFLFWRLSHIFWRGCKLISEGESSALLSCSLYGFFSSCGNGAVIQHRAEIHPVTGWCVVATLYLPVGSGGYGWWCEAMGRRCFFATSELFWTIMKDFSVFYIVYKIRKSVCTACYPNEWCFVRVKYELHLYLWDRCILVKAFSISIKWGCTDFHGSCRTIMRRHGSFKFHTA